MFCLQCGAEASGKFCWTCGQSLAQSGGIVARVESNVEFVPVDWQSLTN